MHSWPRLQTLVLWTSPSGNFTSREKTLVIYWLRGWMKPRGGVELWPEEYLLLQELKSPARPKPFWFPVVIWVLLYKAVLGSCQFTGQCCCKWVGRIDCCSFNIHLNFSLSITAIPNNLYFFTASFNNNNNNNNIKPCDTCVLASELRSVCIFTKQI